MCSGTVHYDLMQGEYRTFLINILISSILETK